jgi:hypothetical protein
MKDFRPYVSRAIMYLPLNSTAEDDFVERFTSHVQLIVGVHYRGPTSEARTYNLAKPLSNVEYQGQMNQAVIVFITWMETDAELVKQKSFKTALGEPDNVRKRYLGMEEQNCKFWCNYFVQVEDLAHNP